MFYTPPTEFIETLQKIINDLLVENPAATSSEQFLQHHVEFELMKININPKYFMRIGINYHGAKVQHIGLDNKGKLIGWNPDGDALGIGSKAKMLLANYTIFDRLQDEPMMSDTKVGGGVMPKNKFVRIEYKVRGWLGKTKNLDGKQLEKDLNLLKNDNADLLVIALSETAHKKWRGEGPAYQVKRRTSISRLEKILFNYEDIVSEKKITNRVNFEGQNWNVNSIYIEGGETSNMPRAGHILTMCYKN